MGRRVRRVMVIGTAVAATAAIGGTALAHESSTVGNSFLGDFASHLGVSPAKVREAYQATVIDRIEAAVKAGRLSRVQADAIEAHVKSHPGGQFFFGGTHGGFDHGRFENHGGFDHPGPFAHRGPSPFDAAATYLGISGDALHASLASGKTLAQIAKANGKTVSGLEVAMTLSFRARLAAAVKAGRLTKQQANHFARSVTSHLDDFVQHGFHHQLSPPHSEHS
jgi:hypothetical protein